MPKLGKPEGANAFGRVTMAAPSRSSEGKLGGVGGIRGEVEFVDRKEHNKIGKDGFLKLLTHQLSNQDPLKPMDQKQFAADLAQFSQLEQLTALNSHFQEMGAARGGEDKFYGASFLGKEVVIQGNALDYDEGTPVVGLSFALPEDAQELTVKIFDDQDQMIGRIDRGAMPKGEHRIPWDGRMIDGTRAASGNYKFEVEAVDMQTRRFRARTKESGMVTGIGFEKGGIVLTVDGRRQVFLKDVVGLKVPDGKNSISHNVNFSQLKKNDASSYSDKQEETIR